jgi:ABC-2 type transport system permease protein
MPGRRRWHAEWRLFASDRLPWLLLIVFGVLVAYGTSNGVRWADFQAQVLGELTASDSTRLSALAATLERKAAGDSTVIVPHIGALGASGATRHAVLPLSPLAPLAVGATDLYPYYARVSVRAKQSFMTSDEVDNPHNLLAGRFDLVFVVVYVLPLFLLALTYNVVSAEREQGTMALWLSQPVAARRVLLTKLAVRVGFVLAVVLVGVVVAAVAAGVPIASTGALPLVLFLFAVLVYAAFWVAVALTVNASARSSATNAVLLLGAWLLVVVVIPSSVAAGVTAVYPTPSRVALTTALREAGDRATAQGDTAVSQFLADHPELAQSGASIAANVTPNAWARTLAQQEAAGDAMRARYAAFDSALAVQHRVADRISMLSPAIMVQDVLHDIAGRGVSRFRRFDTQLDAFHGAWQRYFFQRVFANKPFTAQDFAALPHFSFVEVTPSDMLRAATPPLLAIVLPTLMLGLWGGRRIARITGVGGSG